MEAVNHERDGLRKGFQHRDEEGFADALADGDAVVLGDAIDGIDLIPPFDAVLIEAVHVIRTQVAKVVVRQRRSAFAEAASLEVFMGPSQISRTAG